MDTVDGSQGAEADVVLLSCVRANRGAAIGFVSDWRRLNVAITRAKKACLVIGHAATLGRAAAGDAAADLVRAASEADAMCTADGRLVTLALELGAPWRRRPPSAPAPSPALVDVPTAAAPSPPRVVTLPKRALVRAERHAAAATDDDGTFLAARAAELDAFVRSCGRTDIERAEKRQRQEREAKAAFEPPAIY